jgi:Uma2 family endonuclease
VSIALAIPDRVLTREEYYLWCAAQPSGRFERIDGRIVTMAPERVGHVRAKLRVVLELRRAIAAAGIACEALTDGVAVTTGESDYQPDATVNCGTSVSDEETAAPNPVVVVEVLSPSTASADTSAKLIGYFRVSSIVHYLIVHPTRRTVIHHRRAGERIDTAILSAGQIALDPPGIAVLIDNFYTDDPSTG